MLLNCDQAAAMPADEEVLGFFVQTCRIAGANQESLHQESREIRKALDAAGAQLAADLTGGDEFTVCWSDSGTGIFNLLYNAGLLKERRVITSHLEHPALSAMLKAGNSSLTFLECTREGRLEKREGSFELAALTAVQSELGVIQDLPALFGVLPDTCIRFADAVQMAGKLPMASLGRSADLIAVSGIKFGSPGGAALLVRKSAPWSGKFLEAAARSRHPYYTASRVFPPAALSCAYAVHKRCALLESSFEKMKKINCFLRRELESEHLRFTVPEDLSSPYILHCYLPGKQGAVVVRLLSERNIMAGSGSACAAESAGGSPALKALGFNKKESFSGLRLSFGFDFDEEQAEFLAENLLSVLKNY
ncbi:MAG: aminotransferase class V-fold PLP-dependent enzyme [Lentisphaeria bacterium]|nr:aminotransferase class V-fold PLP-dependent enzyme [Lentisphaeria bacterium]